MSLRADEQKYNHYLAARKLHLTPKDLKEDMSSDLILLLTATVNDINNKNYYKLIVLYMLGLL